MTRVLIQGIGIVVFFFMTWFVLNQIDWMTVLNIEEAANNTEEKLGELFWDYYNDKAEEVESSEIIDPIDSLLSKICKSNNLTKSAFKLHIMQDSEVNAFAMPDGHLVLNTGLIEAAENESQLSGVIGHEIAHIQLDHIMKKLIKEIGLSVILTTAGGSGGTEMIKEMAKMLSSSSYDRSLEKEADLKAVDYLSNANMDPDEFATFLFTLSLDESSLQSNLSWISTHPNSEGRAEYILNYSKEVKKESVPVLTTTTWLNLKSAIKNSSY